MRTNLDQLSAETILAMRSQSRCRHCWTYLGEKVVREKEYRSAMVVDREALWFRKGPYVLLMMGNSNSVNRVSNEQGCNWSCGGCLAQQLSPLGTAQLRVQASSPAAQAESLFIRTRSHHRSSTPTSFKLAVFCTASSQSRQVRLRSWIFPKKAELASSHLL